MAEGRGRKGPGIWPPHVYTENEIAKIPAHTFLGLPNLEWLDLSKNKLDAQGLHPHAFKVRSGPSTRSPWGPGLGRRTGRSDMAPGVHCPCPALPGG